MWETLSAFVPFVTVLAVTSVLVVLARVVLGRRVALEADARFLRGIVVLTLVCAGLIGVAITLPIEEAFRTQLLSVVGLVLSATITLSSTTFVGNVIAGLLLRGLRKFRVGDYIRVEDHGGRVSERRMLHTEIQTEESNLTTLPNLYLVVHPVTVVRTSGTGTVISADVSLGYDVARDEVERVLVEAAAASGLAEPFIRIRELGDSSVTYQCAGLLRDPTRLFAASSLLRGSMLDRLHAAGIEIVSPQYMNQRRLAVGQRVAPPRRGGRDGADDPLLPREDVVFDKAEQAVSAEKLRSHLERLSRKAAELGKEMSREGDPGQKDKIRRELERAQLYQHLLSEKLEKIRSEQD